MSQTARRTTRPRPSVSVVAKRAERHRRALRGSQPYRREQRLGIAVVAGVTVFAVLHLIGWGHDAVVALLTVVVIVATSLLAPRIIHAFILLTGREAPWACPELLVVPVASECLYQLYPAVPHKLEHWRPRG